MSHLTFLLLGLGVGAAYAAVAMGLVVVHSGTGVVNIAQAATAMWAAFVYDEIRSGGDLVLPIGRLPVGHALPTALALGIMSAAVVGLAGHLLVFRPLRAAPPLAKLVASVGMMLTLQALVVLRFGSRPRAVAPVLPGRPIRLGSVTFSSEVVLVAAVALVAATLFWATLRFTRFGLAIRGAAQNELAVSLSGFSPDLLAGVTWIGSAAVTGAVAILAAASTGLNPSGYTLLVVPALAAALAARLESPAVACLVGLALGSVQAELTNLGSRDWWPSWAAVGAPDVVPFVVIVVSLFVAGHRLPRRGSVVRGQLPPVRRSPGRRGLGLAAVALGMVAISATQGSYRFGLITSLSVSVIALSLVILTGLVGQVSLAQAAFAGAAGFALSGLTHHLGVPFPWSLLLAALVAGVLGVLVGVPALRIRGMQLAVVTLAGAVAIEQLVFRNPRLSPSGGNPIADPSLFGLDVAIRRGEHLARWPFAVVVLVALTLVAAAVARLTRGHTGRSFLAVRGNEAAAAASGIDVARTKLLAFGLSSFVAGIGGALIGYSRGQLSADSFTTLTGISFLAWAYVGGITSVAGAVVAGLFAPLGLVYVLVDRHLGWGRYYGLLTGLALVLTTVRNADGLAGGLQRVVSQISGRRGRRREAFVGHFARALPGPDPDPSGPPDEPAPPARLEVKDLSVRRGGVQAADGVSLTITGGRVVGLIGPNGAGKSTVVDAITGFVPATGTVELDGVRLNGLPPHRRARLGVVRTWQSHELFEDLSVAENVEVACEPLGRWTLLRDLIGRGEPVPASVAPALAAVGLADRAAARPGALSFGQRRLVGVARVLGVRPRVALLDEPAAGLYPDEVQALARRLRQMADAGVGVLLVDHDMSLVLSVCDEVHVLDGGKLIAHGTPAQVRHDPAVIAAYLGSLDG